MSISQISVFVESQPGHMKSVLDTMAQAQVNVRGYCAADTGDYGIVRFVVDKPELGLKVLQEAGYAAKLTNILCVEVSDTPGELSRVLGVISDAGINITYSYSLVSTYIALQTGNDLQHAEELLAQTDLKLVNDNDLQL